MNKPVPLNLATDRCRDQRPVS